MHATRTESVTTMRGAGLAAAALLVLLAPPSARAEDRVEDVRFVRDRIVVSIDALFARFDQSAQVNRDNSDGSGIDFEDDLGFDTDTKEGSVYAAFKLGVRNRVMLRYEAFDRDSSRTLERDIDVGDNTYLAGSQVRADTDLSVVHADWRYDFIHKEKVEFGMGAGLVFASAHFGLEADIIDTGGPRRISDEVDIASPVPEIGMGVDWFPGKHFIVRAGFQYFQADIGEIDGNIADLTARVEYYPWKHVGFALGARGTHYEVNFDDEDGGHSGDFEYSDNGPTLGVTFAW
jgi:hypothetical protein